MGGCCGGGTAKNTSSPKKRLRERTKNIIVPLGLLNKESKITGAL